MPALGRLSMPGGSGDQAESDEDRARDPPLYLQPRAALAEPAPRRAGREGPHRVARERDDDEDQAEQEDLARHPAGVRIHELRQEREEEDGRLRVQHVHDDALPEERPARTGRTRLDLLDGLAREEPPDPEEDQVRRAEVL